MFSFLLCVALMLGDVGGVVAKQDQKNDSALTITKVFAGSVNDAFTSEDADVDVDSDSLNEEFEYPESNENMSAIEVDVETFFLIINDSSLFQLSRSNGEWSLDFSTEIVDGISNDNEMLGPGDNGGGSVNCLKIDNNTVVCAFVNGDNIRIIVMVRDGGGKWTIALDSGWNKDTSKQPKMK